MSVLMCIVLFMLEKFRRQSLSKFLVSGRYKIPNVITLALLDILTLETVIQKVP